MSEWVVAAISAGSALAGGLVTGWFTRGAGSRQADAARHAGDRQADALIATVHATLDEQRAQAHWNARRAVYVEFLGVVGAQLGHGIPFGVRQQPDHGAASRAMLLLELEGPDAVTRAGRVLAEASPRGQRQAPGGEEAFTAAREAFLTAARHALS